MKNQSIGEIESQEPKGFPQDSVIVIQVYNFLRSEISRQVYEFDRP